MPLKVNSEFDVVLGVLPNCQWGPLVKSTARAYLEARGFPEPLIGQCLSAIGEVMEQMVSLQIARGLSQPFEIGLGWEDDAVSIHFTYAASIPLNPHQEPEYEVPASDSVFESVSLDGLWLHIIKRTMDRVFFRVDGARASLVMIKYHRDARHAREAWVLGRRPNLRPDLVLEYPPDERQAAIPSSSILHDTRGRSVLKLSRSETFVAARLNGERTLREIYLDHAVELGPLSPRQVTQLYERLEAARLLETRGGEGRKWSDRWTRWLSPVYSLPHPDRIVTWFHRLARFLFRPMSVAAFLVIGLSGLLPLYRQWDSFVTLIPQLDREFTRAPLLLVAAYVLTLIFVAMHELAHGVTCKHFGGSIKQLGIMWYLAMFIFFCDTTSAWTFPKKSQRIWVSLAGPLMSWFLWGISAWFAGATLAANSPWASVWVALVLMSGFSLIMNFNPLIRMDAYYMLVDWTGVPNLQSRAFQYLRRLAWERFRPGSKADETQPTVRERRIFLAYGLLSAAMSLVFVVLPFVRLVVLWKSQRQFTIWGLMGLVAVVVLVASIIFKAAALTYAARHREYKLR